MKFLILLCALFCTALAGVDYCRAGSDSACKLYGADYCCAKVNMTKDGVQDSYHYCADRVGIDATGGVFNQAGFSGTWFCNKSMTVTLGYLMCIYSFVFVLN